MDVNPLFQAALGLTPPWTVDAVSFDPKGAEGRGRLDIRLAFPRGSRFPCPTCSQRCPIHDTVERTWRHMDFFQHEAYLIASVPRASCKEHGVLTVSVPWARDGSGFTLLFEAYVMLMVGQMPVRALARFLGEQDTRLWRLLQAHVKEARSRVDTSKVREVLVDETSQAKGQTYVSIFMEPAQRETKPRVLFVADGRSAGVFGEFVKDLEAHGGEASKIRDVCMDMSNSFQKGAAESLPRASVTFDRFHVMKLVGEAVDEVRRQEQRTQPLLRGTRYTWLRNPEGLSGAQAERFATLSRLNLNTVVAYQMRLNLREVWTQSNATSARRMLLAWCRWVRRKAKPKAGKNTGLEAMLRLATTIREKADGILNYFRRGLTQGVIEGLGSIVQAARARARGYRNPETYKTIIYLLGGRLDFNLPALSH
jgi:transposase